MHAPLKVKFDIFTGAIKGRFTNYEETCKNIDSNHELL